MKIQGKPINTIIDDIELDSTFHTLIINASNKEVNILLPPAKSSYGDIFVFKVINFDNDTNIQTPNSDYIFTNLLLTNLVIVEGEDITLQCDGNSTWYSI